MRKFTTIALVQLFCKSFVLQYCILQLLKIVLHCITAWREICQVITATLHLHNIILCFVARATVNVILLYTHAVTCDYPPTQLFYGHVVVVTGSDSPPVEGQFITYTCPPGFVLTGPNMSACMENKEWEPNPGKVKCIGKWILSLMKALECRTLAAACCSVRRYRSGLHLSKEREQGLIKQPFIVWFAVLVTHQLYA